MERYHEGATESFERVPWLKKAEVLSLLRNQFSIYENKPLVLEKYDPTGILIDLEVVGRYPAFIEKDVSFWYTWRNTEKGFAMDISVCMLDGRRAEHIASYDFSHGGWRRL